MGNPPQTARIMPCPPRAYKQCIVPRERLVQIEIPHHTFTGQPTTGHLITLDVLAPLMQRVFDCLYAHSFPIQRITPIDSYAFDDGESMAHNNTSCFNPRKISNSSRWSLHTYGAALDINPVQNPVVYAAPPKIQPTAGVAHEKRDPLVPGMVDALVPEICALGFQWGGHFESFKDYHHFQLPRPLATLLVHLGPREAAQVMAVHEEVPSFFWGPDADEGFLKTIIIDGKPLATILAHFTS